MEKLILVRSGDHGKDFGLNETGKRKMKSITEKLKKFINGNRTVVFSSNLRRARESAEIVSASLKVSFEQCKFLQTNSADLVENFDRTIDLISSNEDAGTFIAITHYGFLTYFPEYFARKELKATRFYSNPFPIDRGEARIINLKHRYLIHVN